MTVAKTRPENIDRADRQRAALDLRREGKSYDEIGAALGIAPQSAHRLVSRALEALTTAPALELQRLEVERLDALQAAVWPAAVAGDLPAVDRALRIAERRARLLSLDRAIPTATLPATRRAYLASRAPPADGDTAPDTTAAALAELDALAELAWPAARDGDLTAVDRLITIAKTRAAWTGADKGASDDTDSLRGMFAVLERAREAAANHTKSEGV